MPVFPLALHFEFCNYNSHGFQISLNDPLKQIIALQATFARPIYDVDFTYD